MPLNLFVSSQLALISYGEERGGIQEPHQMQTVANNLQIQYSSLILIALQMVNIGYHFWIVGS